MSEWLADESVFGDKATDAVVDSGPVRDPVEAAADADDAGSSIESDGGSETGLAPIPDFIRKAMEMHGVDPEQVAAKLAAEGDNIFPSDEHEAFLQAAARTGRMRCEGCKAAVNPNDPAMLVEVIGWSRRRTQGGQNHVIDRAETGRVMCGDCGQRLIHLGSIGYAQETLV